MEVFTIHIPSNNPNRTPRYGIGGEITVAVSFCQWSLTLSFRICLFLVEFFRGFVVLVGLLAPEFWVENKSSDFLTTSFRNIVWLPPFRLWSAISWVNNWWWCYFWTQKHWTIWHDLNLKKQVVRSICKHVCSIHLVGIYAFGSSYSPCTSRDFCILEIAALLLTLLALAPRNCLWQRRW